MRSYIRATPTILSPQVGYEIYFEGGDDFKLTMLVFPSERLFQMVPKVPSKSRPKLTTKYSGAADKLLYKIIQLWNHVITERKHCYFKRDLGKSQQKII